MSFDAWRHFDQLKQQGDQTRENSGRLAHAYIRTDSTGWGETAYPDSFVFGVLFEDKPYVSYSFDIDDTYELIDTRFPRSIGFVYKWAQDKNDFYVGAWLAVAVDDQSSFITPSGDGVTSPNYKLNHHFTFSGVALKSVPDYLAQG